MNLDGLLVPRMCIIATDPGSDAGCSKSDCAASHRLNALPPGLCHG